MSNNHWQFLKNHSDYLTVVQFYCFAFNRSRRLKGDYKAAWTAENPGPHPTGVFVHLNLLISFIPALSRFPGVEEVHLVRSF